MTTMANKVNNKDDNNDDYLPQPRRFPIESVDLGHSDGVVVGGFDLAMFCHIPDATNGRLSEREGEREQEEAHS